jgi:hypothetical protein
MCDGPRGRPSGCQPDGGAGGRHARRLACRSDCADAKRSAHSGRRPLGPASLAHERRRRPPGLMRADVVGAAAGAVGGRSKSTINGPVPN